MAEEQIVNASRTDVDNAVFGAAEDIAAEMTQLTMRERMKLTLHIADRVMQSIDNLDAAQVRSENARKAAQARHANKAPKPGPAIPPPTVDPTQGQSPLVKPPVVEQAAQQTTAPLPPPPHPALMPQGVPAAPQPFGSPPA